MTAITFKYALAYLLTLLGQSLGQDLTTQETPTTTTTEVKKLLPRTVGLQLHHLRIAKRNPNANCDDMNIALRYQYLIWDASRKPKQVVDVTSLIEYIEPIDASTACAVLFRPPFVADANRQAAVNLTSLGRLQFNLKVLVDNGSAIYFVDSVYAKSEEWGHRETPGTDYKSVLVWGYHVMSNEVCATCLVLPEDKVVEQYWCQTSLWFVLVATLAALQLAILLAVCYAWLCVDWGKVYRQRQRDRRRRRREFKQTLMNSKYNSVVVEDISAPMVDSEVTETVPVHQTIVREYEAEPHRLAAPGDKSLVTPSKEKDTSKSQSDDNSTPYFEK